MVLIQGVESKMGRGGRRPGAGAKPGSKPKISRKRADVVNMKGEPVAVLPPVLADELHEHKGEVGLLEPPDDLGLSEVATVAWRRLAPYAIAERTLTPSRTPGFAKLCEEWAYCAAFEKRIGEIGVAAAESDRLLKRLNDYKKQLKASLGDFNLRSFGKPAAPEKPKATANPFAKLA